VPIGKGSSPALGTHEAGLNVAWLNSFFVEDFFAFCDEESLKVLDETAISKAVGYARPPGAPRSTAFSGTAGCRPERCFGERFAAAAPFRSH